MQANLRANEGDRQAHSDAIDSSLGQLRQRIARMNQPFALFAWFVGRLAIRTLYLHKLVVKATFPRYSSAMASPKLTWRLEDGYSRFLDGSSIELSMTKRPLAGSIELHPVALFRKREVISAYRPGA